MVSYKEQKEKQSMFVLLKGDLVIAVFGSFKGACEHAKKLDEGFPSYWTLIRTKKDRVDFNGYSIQAVKKL